VLLTAIGNLPYCGGGFKALPLAKANDGLLDLLIVSKMSRAKFIALVGDYRKGTFMNANTCKPVDKFKNVIKYEKCKKIIIENTQTVCADGEVEAAESVTVEVIPNAIRYIN